MGMQSQWQFLTLTLDAVLPLTNMVATPGAPGASKVSLGGRLSRPTHELPRAPGSYSSLMFPIPWKWMPERWEQSCNMKYYVPGAIMGIWRKDSHLLVIGSVLQMRTVKISDSVGAGRKMQSSFKADAAMWKWEGLLMGYCFRRENQNEG